MTDSPYVNCGRCGQPQLGRVPPALQGAREIAPGFWLCKDGRECTLRYKRKRRHQTKEGEQIPGKAIILVAVDNPPW